MKHSPLKTVLFIVAFCFASIPDSASGAATQYPFISVTPASPAAGKDSVKLLLALGTAGNSCMAPTFTDISYSIQQSPLAIYPPIYNVALSYTTVPVPPGKMCPMIYAPVDYGPAFSLGKLALGTYNVTDQITRKLVASFSVVNSFVALKDTVTVTPKSPTTKDSLHFDLFNASLDCCTQYHNNQVTVTDTVIMLSFQYLNAGNCRCLIAGSHTTFACGPQKAGKFAIYKVQSIYCPPGQVCPLAPGPIQLVRVGEVVVSSTSVADQGHEPALRDGLILWQEKNTLKMDYTLKQPGSVRVNVYNARGVLAGQIYNGQSLAGPHRVSWNAAVPGAYFLSMEINGVPACGRKILISQ
jgi:hypothetical protein